MKNTLHGHTVNTPITPQLPTLINKEQLNTISVNKDGSPDYLAINIYYDSLRSWYNPKKQYQEDGNVLHIKKLKSNGIYYSAEQLSQIHGCSKETIRKKLVKLEQLGLIHRNFEHQSTPTTNSYNHRCIFVWKNTSHFFNPYGVDRKKIKKLKSQTNAEYVKSKHGIEFGAKARDDTILEEGGIHTLEDTKELREVITKVIRSNVHAHESNSCNNSNSSIPTKTTELVETESGLAKGESSYYQANTKTAELVETLDEAQAVETTSPIPATVTQLKTKSPRLANKRKTRTKDEQKQRKTSHVISNGFLAGGKRLREIQPYLTDEVCDKLRISSGRAFTNKAIREITKAIATSERGRQAIFQHINGIVAYLTPALVNEKRDAVKTSGEHYYTLAGMTAEDKLWQKQEKYLASVEQDSITHICPENQLKAKLANALKKNTAYQLLSSLRKLKLVGSTMQIHLKRVLSLTEHEKAIILAQVQATYETVSDEGYYQEIEHLEFMVDEQMPIASNSNIQERQNPESLKLPEGVWGKIAQSFVVEYGQELYTHWISKLEFEQDEINKSITLKANSGMVKDRIEEQYMPFLTSVAQGLGITTIELI